MNQTTHIRKKACPYCSKKLHAATKRKWQRNLARHLQNCAPWQRTWIEMTSRLVVEILGRFAPDQPPVGGYAAGNRRAEIEALERMYSK